ncbi:MAG: cupin domain-containing protein [Deltaproteobacteria bacterium]|nr:cupin domain-containing protein [Deltaproteobacteria bacterium]
MRPVLPLSVLALAAALPVTAADAPAARVVVARESAQTYPILGGKGEATLLLNAETGSKEAALSVLTLAPGAEVPQHVHEGSAELLYIESGTCELVVGGVKVQAGPGSAVRIPAGVPHSARVTSAVQSLRAVQVYVGPGPEQRFRAPAK